MKKTVLLEMSELHRIVAWEETLEDVDEWRQQNGGPFLCEYEEEVIAPAPIVSAVYKKLLKRWRRGKSDVCPMFRDEAIFVEGRTYCLTIADGYIYVTRANGAA